MAQAVKARTGGDLVAETLRALGASVCFGVPGVHMLAVWEGLRAQELMRVVGFRTELNAGFAADGYARVSGRPAPLLLSTGPGALMSLAALMEAASAHVPVVAVASEIPSDLVGRGRGYLHELPDQLGSFTPVVKWAARAESAEAIPALLEEAWRRALTPPSGPVFVEIPVDYLAGETSVPPPTGLDAEPAPLPLPDEEVLNRAAELLQRSERPVVWAGGGVLRSRAWAELKTLAFALDAPVVTTYMGKGAFPEDDPLSAGSGCDEAAFRELVEQADVLVCVGTELGAETTGQYTFGFSGQLVQIDAAPERIGATYPALGLVGDARAILPQLYLRFPGKEPRGGNERAAAVHERVARGLATDEYLIERRLLEVIRTALPRQAIHAWDMTILGYWAAAHFPALEPRRFLYPLGSGTLGYAWPAALGASLAERHAPVLAVVGDGGALYGLQELATARQNELDAVLLVIDDGGYGILREYQQEMFGETMETWLETPDFAAVARAFGVPAETTEPGALGEALARALEYEGPALVHVRVPLRMWTPTA